MLWSPKHTLQNFTTSFIYKSLHYDWIQFGLVMAPVRCLTYHPLPLLWFEEGLSVQGETLAPIKEHPKLPFRLTETQLDFFLEYNHTYGIYHSPPSSYQQVLPLVSEPLLGHNNGLNVGSRQVNEGLWLDTLITKFSSIFSSTASMRLVCLPRRSIWTLYRMPINECLSLPVHVAISFPSMLYWTATLTRWPCFCLLVSWWRFAPSA